MLKKLQTSNLKNGFGLNGGYLFGTRGASLLNHTTFMLLLLGVKEAVV